METQIINDNACITILNDGIPLSVIKAKISAIDTVKNELVRIDVGHGPLRHIYIRLSDVTVPAGLANVNALMDAIKNMLGGDPSSNSDPASQTASTRAFSEQMAVTSQAQSAAMDSLRQEIINASDRQAALLEGMTQVLNQINLSFNGTNDHLKYPVLIDGSRQMVTYYGFTESGDASSQSVTDPKWAVQRVTRNGNGYISEWPNGYQQFTNIWNNRYNLDYKPLSQS